MSRNHTGAVHGPHDYNGVPMIATHYTGPNGSNGVPLRAVIVQTITQDGPRTNAQTIAVWSGRFFTGTQAVAIALAGSESVADYDPWYSRAGDVATPVQTIYVRTERELRAIVRTAEQMREAWMDYDTV